MRHSRQRELILDEVRSGRLDHPTALEVHDAVRERLPRISLGTVYRNLRQLVETGELKAVAADGALRVDPRLEPHAHFVCGRCGRLSDIDVDLAELAGAVRLPGGHEVAAVELLLTGRCARCAPAETTPDPHE